MGSTNNSVEAMRDKCVVAVLGLKLQPGGLPSQELRDRCALGAKIAREENAMKVIPTGGDPEKRGVTEAEAMGKYLLELGVEEEKLLLETEADDTTTNAYNVLKLIQNEVLVHQEKVQLIIVTSDYHMPRSTWNFRVVTAAMNLADSVKIKGAFSNKNMEGMEAVQKTEVEAKLRKELRIINSPWMRSMPATLRGMGLEVSQIEDLEKPRKELEELLSIVTQRKCRAGE